MKKIYLFIVLIVSMIAVSCEDDIHKRNIDNKNASEVDPQYLFSYAMENLARQMADADYNQNLDRFWANYFTQTTYIQESSYDPTNRDVGGSIWDNIYTEILMELKDAKAGVRALDAIKATEAEKANQLGMIKILEVYSWQYLVDNFGNVPYGDALDIHKTNPAYEDAATIYSAIADSLTSAISGLDAGASGFGADADILFGDDIAAWKKFGASLQLKLGMRLADVNASLASTLVTGAVATGVFESNADNAAFAFSSSEPYVNPMYNYFVTDSRNSDFIASDFFINVLKSYADPRIAFYYDDNIAAGYVGGVYGGAGNAYANFSHANPKIYTPDYPGILMDYTAVEFFLAEAVQRGIISGDANTHYVNAITSSFEFWGVGAADLATYLAQPSVVYDAANWKEKIGMQKYIASFNQGHEGWTEAKRLDFPTLAVAASNKVPNPNRLLYPTDESLVNAANYNAAASAIGGDELATKLFWDVN
ncbi:SusD/RagB family nutrient-binding outer membrane lipoprotein [Marinifilum caeruleilacunae]|uniref:SusD/RagB family nutrient-binding outer membrane lipoprotein n=1 Tax=Marinifilum caeruleilacunae TaxID=2499076 RepID=A0ABX1WVW3_9BACT|nr:SusD/RagB family nutrient-binding outer membrane lipoprotein [Marinifilum caeruleilacunae]NOU60035.1 SusD/RagB family nutrient-binding outer membrane lipoprotein [Marinifilum caeruleilacunae]